MSDPFRVLISGGGVAGPTLAFWLARASTSSHPIHITIIERATAFFKAGQGIDIEGPAKDVVTRMGLLETIQSRTTGEAGFVCLNDKGLPCATFTIGGITREIEIMRGDLCDILTTAVKDMPNVTLQYQRSITEIKHTNDEVHATITTHDGKTYEEVFDALVAADGMRSKTRDMILSPGDTKDCIRSLDMYTAYFSVPAEPQDSPNSRFQNHVGGRSVFVRPVSETISSSYLIARGHQPALAKSLASRDKNLQKQAWIETFSDVKHSTELSRALEQLQTSDNVYFDEIAQVKLPKWSQGRCGLLGDTAYAPSPLTGQGTALAILGAYVLAGELAKNRKDPAAAFGEYEKKLRGYVERAQTIALGGRAPKIANPETAWGIWLLRTIIGIVAWSNIYKLLPAFDAEKFPLPDYNFG